MGVRPLKQGMQPWCLGEKVSQQEMKAAVVRLRKTTVGTRGCREQWSTTLGVYVAQPQLLQAHELKVIQSFFKRELFVD
jgi:hypothetical protein